jgi:hypothetical protein
VIEDALGTKKARNAFKYLVFWEEINLTQPREKAFRVNRNYPKIVRERKQRIARRLDPKRGWHEQPKPMLSASNIHFEMAERGRALNYGGIGAIHLMGQRVGLAKEIDSRLQLLKRHLPYHESDHVLNLAYNALLEGQRLEDIELRRNDEAFLDGLGAQRIPDPTTSGDFTRRFDEDSVLELMEAINTARQRVWEKQPEDFLQQAFIDRGRDKGRLCPSLRTGLPNFLNPALQLVVSFEKIGKPQCALVLRRTSRPRRSRYLAIGSDLFLWPGLSVSSGT